MNGGNSNTWPSGPGIRVSCQGHIHTYDTIMVMVAGILRRWLAKLHQRQKRPAEKSQLTIKHTILMEKGSVQALQAHDQLTSLHTENECTVFRRSSLTHRAHATTSVNLIVSLYLLQQYSGFIMLFQFLPLLQKKVDKAGCPTDSCSISFTVLLFVSVNTFLSSSYAV